METDTKPFKKHIGRKVLQMRELLGFTQEAVAEKLGISQQAVSKIEQSEKIDASMLDRVAKALGVTAESIKNLEEGATVYNIVQNNYDSSTNEGAFQQGQGVGVHNHQCTFNPLDKYIEAVDKIEKLYEKLLKSEQEKVALLKGQLGKL
ncbi:MAG: helix-turn-helix transcriptional regulator [Cytophagales bacterium]|nr:helix-turn-helix transcriptional regulator [Cytophagales bacterium]